MPKQQQSNWNNFPEILSSTLIELIENQSSDQQLNNLVNKHLFSRSVQIISQKQKIIEEIEQKFKNQNDQLEFLYVQHLPIYILIDFEFISKVWSNNELIGLSVDCDVNTDDTVAILPEKKILLSLNAQSYNRVGIVGQQSILNRKKCPLPKYRIVIDLNEPFFNPTKKYYQRTLECLQRSRLTFNVILKSKKLNLIETYFKNCQKHADSNLSNITLKKCAPTYRHFKNLDEPIFNTEKLNCKSADHELKSYIDWCSAQICQIKTHSDDLEVSTFTLEENYRMNNLGDIHGIQINGFFGNDDLRKLIIEGLWPMLHDGNVNATFVHGFENSPQCWQGKDNEHYKNLSGETVFGFSVFGTQKTLIWCQTDDYDFGIEKF